MKASAFVGTNKVMVSLPQLTFQALLSSSGDLTCKIRQLDSETPKHLNRDQTPMTSLMKASGGAYRALICDWVINGHFCV